jgi:hypothetical protein
MVPCPSNLVRKNIHDHDKFYVVLCLHYTRIVYSISVNGSTFWGGIANTSSWTQYQGHPAPTIELINATASSSGAQATASGVQSSATSTSMSMVWTLLFLGFTSYAILA